MTRFFMGWKSGVGGVIKIMANDADNPLTHPNTDYGAFLFNSETAAIGYGNHTLTQPIPSASYSWDNVERPYPNASVPRFTASPNTFGSGYFLHLRIHANNVWADKNAFHYVMQDASAWYQQRYYLRRKNYPSSTDSYTITSTICPFDRVVPYKTGASWSLKTVDSRDSNLVRENVVGIWHSASLWDDKLPLASTPSTGSVPENAGPYASPAPFQNYPQTFACYQLDLPVDNTAYPAVSPGAPVAGQKIVTISPSGAKMSKRGYNVDTATADQLVFDSNKLPMKVIKTDHVTIAANSTLPIPMGRSLAGTTFVDYIVSRASGQAWMPPWPEDVASEVNVAYRFNGTNLVLWNRGPVSVSVRYIVMAQDDLGPSTGTAKVFEAVGNSHVVLRRPGTAGTRLRDTILDSRLSYMPIIAEDWVPISSFVASDLPGVGSNMYRFNISNPGVKYKPYVMAKMAVRLKADPTQIMYMNPFAKRLDNTTSFAASSFMIWLEDTRITLYLTAGSFNRDEDAYRVGAGTWTQIKWDWEPIGVRYYVFAIPTTL